MYEGTSRINIGLSVEQCACPLRLRRDSTLNRQSVRSVSAAQTPRRYQNIQSAARLANCGCLYVYKFSSFAAFRGDDADKPFAVHVLELSSI